MSFLLDPLLLVITGIISVFIGRTPERIRLFAAIFLAAWILLAGLLYVDIIPWPWFAGWMKGSDWMLNSGLHIGLTRSRGVDVLAFLLFATYPLWLWLGVEVGKRIT